MSSPWPPPDPRTLAVPARTRRDRWTTLGLVVLAVAGLGLLAGGTFHALRDRVDRAESPSTWDRDVAGLAADVEHLRGLRFTESVEVTFLAEADFAARVRAGGAATAEQRAAAEEYAAVLRGLGLVDGDIDLIEGGDELVATRLLGFYDPASRELVVRGAAADLRDDPFLRATVVHELTHVLQDQHFDLEALLARTTEAEETAARAFIEADASWVEQQWVRELPADASAAYDRRAREASRPSPALEGIPEVLAEIARFPYVFGPALHAEIRATGSVDDAFGSLPRSTEHVLFPASYAGGDDPLPVDAPTAGAGDEELDTGVLGAFGLFQVLAARLDYAPARDAVDGWGGDAYRTVRRDGAVCILVAVAGDAAADADRLATAFTDWADGVATMNVGRDGELVTIEACDPGERLPPPAHRTETGSGFTALAIRATVVAEVRPTVDDLTTAECVADAVVADVGVDRLDRVADALDPRRGPTEEITAAVPAALATC